MLLRPGLVRLGHEEAGTNGVDRHASRRPVGCRGAREMDHRRLRRLVVPPADAAIGDEAADRSDVDDAAPPALQHRSADQLRAEKAMGEIEVHESSPVCQRLTLDRNVGDAPADVVDENVDRPQLGERLGAHGLARVGISDVGRDRPGLAPPLANLVGGPGERLRVAGDEDHGSARVREGQRDHAPEAAASPGHESAPSVKTEAIENIHPGAALLLLADNLGPDKVNMQPAGTDLFRTLGGPLTFECRARRNRENQRCRNRGMRSASREARGSASRERAESTDGLS